MDKYDVMLYPRAFRDIDDIYAYIALEKLSPENAKAQTDRIWDAIKALGDAILTAAKLASDECLRHIPMPMKSRSLLPFFQSGSQKKNCVL